MSGEDDGFHAKGWKRFDFDQGLADWVQSALAAARQVVADPVNAHWLRYGGTWFAGVNALPNGKDGAVGGGPPLSGAALAFAKRIGGDCALDRAQISVCYPGYPRPMAGETEAQFLFRRNRDAAHVDGLMARGAERRRFLGEPHGFILGIPMSEADPDASPLVIWEGSHHIMLAMFRKAYLESEPRHWPEIDITEAYVAARKLAFESCPRIAVHAKPGEAYVLHRHALHGVAPWAEHAKASSDGRMIAYFRPPMDDLAAWLNF